MNKLFSKLGTLLLGASLVVAGGVAVSSKKAGEAKASDAVGECCDMSAKIVGTTGYSKEHTYGDYLIYGGQNNNNGWEYFKFGAKKANKTDPDKVTEGYVKGTKAVNYDIKRIDVVLLAGASSSADVTMNAVVASDSSFASVVDTTATQSVNHKTAATLSIQPSSGTSWGSGNYYCVNLNITNKSTTNGILFVEKINFIYESSTPRGEISINEVSNPVLNVDSSIDLSYTWTPASGSDATIASSSWTSSNPDVLSVSGNTVTGVAPGVATVTLNATDSLSETYEVVSEKFFVTNAYDFEIGDNVALYSEGALMELESINKGGSNHYGVGVAYTGTPNGTYLLNVEEGSVAGSFAFKNGDDYLAWTSGNTLTSSTTKNDNSSWRVVVYDEYMIISNVGTPSREIWWNSGSPRFACYEGKTPTSTGYNSVSLVKIEEAPVRGTISISNSFANSSREDISGDLAFEFTPAEGDSATITSYSWVSSNTDALTISGSHYTGVGTGKVKITLNATDSNGQEYTVSTPEFTLVDVVSGSYQKKTSVAVGDTVVIACDTVGTQMAGIASKIGIFVYYDMAPADVCVFTLEAGTSEGSYALKHDDKYLNWTSGTDISFVDEKSSNSSWTITFDEGDATISCVALDGEDHRYIAWNASSPRFTTYKSGQTPVQLYGPATEYGATEFANELISMTNDYCAAYEGETKTYAELKDLYATVWSTLSGADHYGKLSDTDIGLLVNADAKESSEDPIEIAMYRYDLITAKYALDGFITDRPAAAFSIYSPSYQSNVDSSSSITIIVIVAVASMTLLGVTLVLRKRKHQ